MNKNSTKNGLVRENRDVDTLKPHLGNVVHALVIVDMSGEKKIDAILV